MNPGMTDGTSAVARRLERAHQLHRDFGVVRLKRGEALPPLDLPRVAFVGVRTIAPLAY